ncbi:MAG: hypothetical protein B7Y01_04895, partial [Xanthobacter sp. 17-67-6]
DETGYLVGDTAALAEQMKVSPKEVESVLRLIQTFEPTGVGARTLSECLALQLRERNRCDPAMEALLANLERHALCMCFLSDCRLTRCV